MASYYQQAGEAIGSVIAESPYGGAHNWGNIVPADDWGMNIPVWADMLDEVRVRFEQLIVPCAMRRGETLSGARTKPLYQLQNRMAHSVVCEGDDDAEA